MPIFRPSQDMDNTVIALGHSGIPCSTRDRAKARSIRRTESRQATPLGFVKEMEFQTTAHFSMQAGDMAGMHLRALCNYASII